MKGLAAAGFLLTLLLAARVASAAVGCELNDPDRDVRRLFPGATGYKAFYLSIQGKGGAPLLARIEERLGDRFTGLFETIDVPYTIYAIYRGKETAGYIHGVNQKGQYGGIQVFLALDLAGTIRSFYIQKMTGRYAGELRSADFAARFVGLTFADFARYDVVAGGGEGKAAAIGNPAPEAVVDFRAAMRATKKNLILMDELVLSGKAP